MKTVHIIHHPQYTPNQDAFLYPLHSNVNRFREYGIQLVFFSTLSDAHLDCDTVLFTSKFFSKWWRDKGFDAIAGQLLRAKALAKQVIWCDISDSTGTTHFLVLPIVDRYLKSQLLKDKSLYLKKYVGSRIFTDFVHQHWGIRDEVADEPHLNAIVEPDWLAKLTLSWNSGMHYYGRGWVQLRRLQHWLRGGLQIQPNFWRKPSAKRHILCSCRIGTSYPRETVAYPRRMIKSKLQRVVPTQKISLRKYFKEMMHSVSGISPFGLGEISLRDFELTRCGAAMIKQNMQHLETWPNLWIAGESYLDFSWDLSDLNDKVDYAKANPHEMMLLAEQAQNIYQACFTEEGMNNFCQRFIEIV